MKVVTAIMLTHTGL